MRAQRAMRRSHSRALALLLISVGPTFANIVIEGNALASLRGLASLLKESHRQDLQSVSGVDCAALILPVDISPIRSPLAVHTALARRFAGRDIVEIGTRAGDAISCFASVAKSAIAVEVVPKYCQALRARASELGKAASFRIICDDYRNTSLDADMITWWQQVQAGCRVCDIDVAASPLLTSPHPWLQVPMLSNDAVLRHLRRELLAGSVREGASAVLMFDPSEREDGGALPADNTHGLRHES